MKHINGYENGYWIDDQNNKWSDMMYSKEDVERYSKSLNDSYNCLNCMDCKQCISCINCWECTNCDHCTDCSNCTDCIKCEDCKDCEGAVSVY